MSKFSWEKYHKAPVIGILRGMDQETVLKIAESYLEAGFYNLEVTVNTESVVSIVKKLAIEFPELNLGAGTVCTPEQLQTVIEAGAQFIVAPIIDEQVIRRAVEEHLPVFPGAYTPTEIYRAWGCGASAVKVFPASQLGPKYVKDVLAPLDHIKLVPTGGIDLENITAHFEAGAFGVGMGSTLFDRQLIAEGKFDHLKEHFLRLKERISEFIS